MAAMLKIGLDIGTGFVKCVSDYGSLRFPSVYVRRIHGSWSSKETESVGERAQAMLSTMGAVAISPIRRGQPDARYQRQVEMLIRESVSKVRGLAKAPADADPSVRIVVGLPYHAFGYRDAISRTVKRAAGAEKCTAVAQAAGTLVDLGADSAIVVSIGQGTTEIVVIDELEVIDGESSRWASDFVTRKVGKFAHLDLQALADNRDTCARYSKVLAENLAREVTDASEGYSNRYPVALSGGGLLLPGLREELAAGLKGLKILVPGDPVMSNARGLYKLVE